MYLSHAVKTSVGRNNFSAFSFPPCAAQRLEAIQLPIYSEEPTVRSIARTVQEDAEILRGTLRDEMARFGGLPDYGPEPDEERTCPDCNGTGLIGEDDFLPCRTCCAKGVIVEAEPVKPAYVPTPEAIALAARVAARIDRDFAGI